jgi:hypothetical protein
MKRSTVNGVFACALFLCAMASGVLTPLASGEMFRCRGEIERTGQQYPIRIDIVAPEKLSLVPTLSTPQGEFEYLISGRRVGKGILEISIISPKVTSLPDQHNLIVTRKPSTENSLVGFFLNNGYVHSIRVDCRKKGCPFFYYDPFWNEFVQGTCVSDMSSPE